MADQSGLRQHLRARSTIISYGRPVCCVLLAACSANGPLAGGEGVDFVAVCLAVAGVIEVAQEIKQAIEDFKPYIPLIQGLRNPGMRQRHWDIVRIIISQPVTAAQGLDFQNSLRRSRENSRKMTELTKILGKRYDNADFQNFLRKS